MVGLLENQITRPHTSGAFAKSSVTAQTARRGIEPAVRGCRKRERKCVCQFLGIFNFIASNGQRQTHNREAWTEAAASFAKISPSGRVLSSPRVYGVQVQVAGGQGPARAARGEVPVQRRKAREKADVSR